VNDVALAVFTSVSCGAFTGVVVVLLQRAVVAGQVGSPPPVTLAVFTTGDAALIVGVIGMMKLVLAPAARLATVQVTVWPAAEQFAGNVPIVRPVGMTSVIVDPAVVAAVPVLLSVSV
jgi:hypothetical protein